MHTLQDLCLSQWERRDNQGLISTGNHTFTIPGLSQWEIIRRSQTQWERSGNQGFISKGNYKFGRVKLELGLWIHTLNIWLISVGRNQKKLNSMGKRGQRENIFVSLNRKEGTTSQWEISPGIFLALSASSFQICTLQHLILGVVN